jgi:hypothetical protein
MLSGWGERINSRSTIRTSKLEGQRGQNNNGVTMPWGILLRLRSRPAQYIGNLRMLLRPRQGGKAEPWGLSFLVLSPPTVNWLSREFDDLAAGIALGSGVGSTEAWETLCCPIREAWTLTTS